MPFQPVILWTDALIFLLVAVVLIYVIYALRHEHLRAPWRRVIRKPLGVISALLLMVFVITGLLDSLHFREKIPKTNHYAAQVESVLDVLLQPIGQFEEKTYSAPFATHLYSKELLQGADGKPIRAYPRLKYAGTHLSSPEKQRTQDIVTLAGQSAVLSISVWLLFSLLLIAYLAHRHKKSLITMSKQICLGKTPTPWRALLITLAIILIIGWMSLSLSQHYHIFGTDKVGQDIFYQAIKSIRTGLVIGTLTTLVMLPFAVILGAMAGYFGGWVDDVIQYLYTTLSSIPGVLLIAAAILSLQIFISNHPDLFNSMAERADARLLALCIILGVTSWTGLCRVLRGETLKLREMDYTQAARALGVSQLKIIARHILPNVLPIILIAVVLDFSMLVLAEAVLSYVGVGVDPTTLSWGNMINAARLELAREPIVWWPLLAAFLFMFTLVLSANLFADAVREAFDPRA